MDSLLGSLMKNVSGDGVGHLSRQIGADEGRTRKALATAMPLILAGMTRNASRPDGAAALHGALERDHDGSILDDVSGFFGRGETRTGDGILGHVFGDRRASVERGISRTSGLDPSSASRLLAMAAPLVLGALGRRQRQKALDPASLGRTLREEHDANASAAPGLGALTRMLDSDGDGSITDDLADLGKGVAGRLFGG